MLSPIQKSIIADQNALYYGYPLIRLMERAGRGVAEIILKKFGKNKKIAIFCGTGNNGGDGLVAARYLEKSSQKLIVFLRGRKEDIKSELTKINLAKFRGEIIENAEKLNLSQIDNDFDLVLDCLLGTGAKGTLKKEYKKIVQLINKMRGNKISIDLATPGIKSDLNISLMQAKNPGDLVVDIGFPKRIRELVGPGEVRALYTPNNNSHKGDNGKVLIVAGGKRFHGAALLASKIASYFVDLVYFSSTQENQKLIAHMKQNLAEFIFLDFKEILASISSFDAILVGPGLDINLENKKLIQKILKKARNKKIILDASVLSMIDVADLSENILITPHKGEFQRLFSVRANFVNTIKMAQKYGVNILLKGKKDCIVSFDGEVKYNISGNAGLTKGGTGDVLAGFITSLAATNDLFLASCVASFVLGLAADNLFKEKSYYFNASDLIEEIPKTIRNIKN